MRKKAANDPKKKCRRCKKREPQSRWGDYCKKCNQEAESAAIDHGRGWGR